MVYAPVVSLVQKRSDVGDPIAITTPAANLSERAKEESEGQESRKTEVFGEGGELRPRLACPRSGGVPDGGEGTSRAV